MRLGLQLSYDIVKAHGGELKVETKEGEVAEFIIELLIKYLYENFTPRFFTLSKTKYGAGTADEVGNTNY